MKKFNAFISKSTFVILISVSFLNNVCAQIGIDNNNPDLSVKFHINSAAANENIFHGRVSYFQNI